MRILLLIIIILPIFSISSFSENNSNNLIKYDSVLANKLGADNNGMKKYVMAFLKRGKTKIADSTERVNLQKAHMANINRMADIGKLIVAGPFLDNQEIRGIYIFNVETIEEAKSLTESDPAIKAGTLEMDLHPWYGSAAMLKIPEIHKSIQKNK
jgi:uncharacterized protein YciI